MSQQAEVVECFMKQVYQLTLIQMTYLTWLPSFCQKTAGGGFPLVPQRKVTVRPGAVIWSRGRTTI